MRLVERFAFQRLGLYQAALLRIGLSSIMLTQYFWHAGVRQMLWGPYGQLDYSEYLRHSYYFFDIYRYSAAPQYVDIIYWGSAIIAAMLLLGVFPRVTSVAFAITTYSLFARNTLSTDAGQTLLVLLSFLLCFLDSGRVLTVFTTRAVRRVPAPLRFLRNIVHNAALFGVAWQVCMVYAWAAFYKLGGSTWRDGTALHYVANSTHFEVFREVPRFLGLHPGLTALFTYGTVVFQSAFPFLMWNERLKTWLIAMAICLHMGIAVTMGLISFSATMIVADVSLLSDRVFRQLVDFFASAFRRIENIPGIFQGESTRNAS